MYIRMRASINLFHETYSTPSVLKWKRIAYYAQRAKLAEAGFLVKLMMKLVIKNPDRLLVRYFPGPAWETCPCQAANHRSPFPRSKYLPSKSRAHAEHERPLPLDLDGRYFDRGNGLL